MRFGPALLAICGALCIVAAALAQSSSSVPGPPTNSIASATTGAMYASTCNAVVNSTTLTSTFCPSATDPNSATRRTYPANTLTFGKSFNLRGGGTYTVPTGNTVTATINILVGGVVVTSVVTPAAPFGNGAGVDFHADCTVQFASLVVCQGTFNFVVAGATSAPVPINGSATINHAVANVIDVQGAWGTGQSTQSTTVTSAVLTATN